MEVFSTSAAIVAFIVLISFITLLYPRKHAPRGNLSLIPTVGVEADQIFPWSRAILRSITQTAHNCNRGYNDFIKHGSRPFYFPSFGNGKVAVLPPSCLDVLNKPEDEVMAFPIQMEVMQPRYMMGHRDEILFKNAIQFEVVRKHMNKDLGSFAAKTADELQDIFCCFFRFPSDTFAEMGVWDISIQIIGRTANRAFLGLPLCRNEELLDRSTRFAQAVFQGASLISAIPSSLRPFLGPVIGLAAKKHATVCREILQPYVQERLEQWANPNITDMPNDALQWIIERSAKGDKDGLQANVIAQRLLILQLVSIYTTAYALSNILVNLYGSESSNEFVAGIRSECDRVAAEHHGLDTKEAVDKLFRTDSAVKESLRVSPFNVLAPLRIVGADNGLDLGDGFHLEKGERFGAPFLSIHHDNEYYKDALQYDAFRFSREFESPESSHRQSTHQDLSVNVNEHFITFGHGRHTCPGRWYTAQTLKQTLAYIVQNYEVELKGHREKTKSILNIILPPINSRVRIKRIRPQATTN